MERAGMASSTSETAWALSKARCWSMGVVVTNCTRTLFPSITSVPHHWFTSQVELPRPKREGGRPVTVQPKGGGKKAFQSAWIRHQK
jgi:hypothetical protein